MVTASAALVSAIEHDRRGRDATPPQSFNRVHERSLLAARALAPPTWMAKMEGGDEARGLHALGQQADRVNRLDVLLERASPTVLLSE